MHMTVKLLVDMLYFGGVGVDIQQALKNEIHNIQLSDLSKDEKWAKIVELARELGRILLEGDQIN